MSTVFVTQLPSRLEDGGWVPTVDVSPAADFGDVRVILPSGMNFHAAAPAIQQLREALKDFRFDEDYLLPMGDPLVMAASAALLARRLPSFRMLKWDRLQRRYISYEVNL